MCSRIYTMNDPCGRCNVFLGDYDGQLDEILEEVKVDEPRVDQAPAIPGLDVTPGGEVFTDQEAQQWKCVYCETFNNEEDAKCRSCAKMSKSLAKVWLTPSSQKIAAKNSAE